MSLSRRSLSAGKPCLHVGARLIGISFFQDFLLFWSRRKGRRLLELCGCHLMQFFNGQICGRPWRCAHSRSASCGWVQYRPARQPTDVYSLATENFMHDDVGPSVRAPTQSRNFCGANARKQERSRLKNVARRPSRYQPLSVPWQGEVPSHKLEAPGGTSYPSAHDRRPTEKPVAQLRAISAEDESRPAG